MTEAPTPDRSETDGPDRSAPVNVPPVRWPLWIALALIFGVFSAGAVWSFREQSALARSAGFHVPELLPLAIDGFAIAMAAVAWAASLDGRAALFARLGIAVGIACSAATNAAWAWERSTADVLTIVLGGGVPILTMVAFEVLLSEARRQVQRRRGLPGPEPVPLPRLYPVLLAPFSTLRDWRREVLDRTAPRVQFEAVRAARAAYAAEQAAKAVPTAPPPAPDRTPDRLPTGGTVTSITRPTAPRTARKNGRRTGRGSGRVEEFSPVAIRDAEAVIDRYGDHVPPRDQVRSEMRWGSPKTGNALKAVPAVRAARENGRARESSTDKEDAA